MEAKTLICSDLHLHPHQWKSFILPSGRNSRLQNGVDAMLQVISQIEPGDTLMFAGDWFEDQKEIPSDAIDATREILDALLLRKPSKVFFLVGNHDQLSRDGLVHSVGLFHRPSDGFYVIDQPTVRDGWAFLPFRRPADLPAALAALSELYRAEYPSGTKKIPILCHVDLINGISNSGHLSAKGLRLSDFPDWASVVISGHYHRHQTVGDRFMFVGSPYQLSAGESGETKVWLSCDAPPTKLSDLRATEFVGLPRFVEVSAPEWESMESEQKEELIDADFVTVTVPHDRRLSNLPAGVAQKPLPKPQTGVARDGGAATVAEALTKWLIRRGRPDLTELGLAFLEP